MHYVAGLFACLIALQTANAQIDLPGDIEGRLLKPDHRPAAFITVTLRKGCYRTETNAQGQFTFKNIPPGDYVLRAFGPEIEPLRDDVMVVGGVSRQLVFFVTPVLKQVSPDELVYEELHNPVFPNAMRKYRQNWSVEQ